MVRPIVKDVLLLGRRAEAAVEADLPVVQDLMDTLRAHTGHCVGLAANMIGVNKRIIVVDGGGVPFPMLNPVIRKRMGEPYEAEEGCLSHSGTRMTLRYPSIEVEFQSLSLQTCRQRYSGFLAQIIQHELDHCEGVLI